MNENTYYERKIRYLDLLEQGERIGGAGFLKMETRGKEVSLFLSVKGLYPTDTYERDVTLQMAEGEINIGQIKLKGGQGQFTYRADIELPELCGIRIVLGGTREICCKWQEEKKKIEEIPRNPMPLNLDLTGIGRQEKAMPVSAVPDDTATVIDVPNIAPPSLTPLEKPKQNSAEDKDMTYHSREAKSEMAVTTTARNTPERTMRLGTLNTENDDADRWDMESLRREEMRKVQRQTAEGSGGRRRKGVRLMEDKWQQISAIYPHVHPFRDEREYLSISPADFVMLTSKAYRAANNSFLLHGYYNYDHLILAKIEKRGEVVYYIGVPGSYYEREKQVAVMFGFESFECGTEPAQVGDFGYYMMRTEL